MATKKDFILTLVKAMPKFAKKRAALGAEEAENIQAEWDGFLDQTDLIIFGQRKCEP